MTPTFLVSNIPALALTFIVSVAGGCVSGEVDPDPNSDSSDGNGTGDNGSGTGERGWARRVDDQGV